MKNVQLLIWLTQLGLSTAAPLAGFVLLAVWLKNRFGLGSWVLFAGIGIGLISAIDGLRTSLKMMQQQSGKDKQERELQPRSFNDHD